MERERLDHVTIFPSPETPSFWLDVAVSTFGSFLFAALPLHALRDPTRADAFAGCGAFNLFSREAFARTPGIEWLRMEVADDVGLGLMLARAGARTGAFVGVGVVEVTWYPSFSAMARGLEKNLFAVVAHYSYARAIGTALGLVLLQALPLVTLALPFPWPLLLLPCLLGVFFYGRYMAKRLHRKLGPSLLLPVGQLLLAYLLLRSTFACARAGGITWRGTRYPLPALKEGQRLRF